MKYDNLVQRYKEVYSEYLTECNKQINEKGFAEVKHLTDELNDLYPKIYKASIKESQHFTGATLEIYKARLQERINDAQNTKPDFSIYNALKKEYKNQRSNLYSIPKVYDPLNKENLESFKEVIRKRLEYLEVKMYEMGIEINGRKSEYGYMDIHFTDNMERRYEYEKNQLPKEVEQFVELDLTDSKVNEKIIYLKQLGIIDFLQKREEFGISTNAIATALSAITGEKKETIQSYINPILNPDSGQKNNPLNSRKNLEKVNQTLLKLGFKPHK